MLYCSQKKQIIEVLEKLRKHKVCAYVGDRCDCKFGGEGLGPNKWNSGESNGCPELRQAIEILSELTDDEYNKLIGRNRDEGGRNFLNYKLANINWDNYEGRQVLDIHEGIFINEKEFKEKYELKEQ